MFKFKFKTHQILLCLCLSFMANFSTKVFAAKGDPGLFPRRIFVVGDQWLKLEWNADSVIHFEFGKGRVPSVDAEIYRSPLFQAAEFPGPRTFRPVSDTSFSTRDMRIDVNSNGTCFDVTDVLRGQHWTHICAPDFTTKHALVPAPIQDGTRQWKVLSVQTAGVKNAYGLGQIFGEPGDMNVDRNGKLTDTHGDYGNMMASYAGGATGDALFPVVYGLGTGSNSFLFALDNVYKQRWDLTTNTWRIGLFGDAIRGFVVVGSSPLELRKKFMAMSGRPPLPPKKLFGFWMSEYGYDDWREVDERLSSMRRDHFPIDGFFLDLQWFGNVTAGSDYSAMGKLTFDESKFPDPAGRIAAYRKQGIGLIPIEESYIARALPEFRLMGDRGYLAHDCGAPTKPTYLTGANTGNTSEWWGRGGMMDWSNTEGAAFWHDTKRQKLINMGIMGHWLDLGEPEMFDSKSCYHGAIEPGLIQHQDIHNVFSLLWAQTVWDGYKRNRVAQRPFSMLRSGNIGLQHYGAGLWSGDIGGNTESLASHIASHANVSWSGIDYYSSDIGGFHRNRASGQPLSEAETQETFTQWFANSTWFDVPVRSHVMNLDNDRLTAPNRIGHIESNRVNLRERYALTPYYYSLAWKAYTEGAPLFTPMAMAYPADPRFRQSGDQTMLGDLLIGAAAERGIYFRDINLPAGGWYDLRDGSYSESVRGTSSSLLHGVPLYRQGIFQLPVYAREGTLLPRHFIDDSTAGSELKKSAMGEDALKLDVFVAKDAKSYEFTMFEDDGQTNAYMNGAVRQTTFTQQTSQYRTSVKIEGAVGDFTGASTRRGWLINIHGPAGWRAAVVRYGGVEVANCALGSRSNVVCKRPGSSPGSDVEVIVPVDDIRLRRAVDIAWIGNASESSSLHFVCQDSESAPRHHSMFIVGSDPVLGSWDVLKAVPMTTNAYLRGIWTAQIVGLPARSAMEWKCVRVPPQTSGRGIEWQPGANNKFSTGNGGFVGITRGSFGSNIGH